MRHVLRQRIVRELICTSPRPLEFILSIQAIAFGGWLLLPADSFSLSPVWSVMHSIAPEWAWGGLIFTVGLIQFVGLWTEHWMSRRVLGSLDLLLWTAIDLALWTSGAAISVAPILFFTLVVAALVVNISLAIRCPE